MVLGKYESECFSMNKPFSSWYTLKFNLQANGLGETKLIFDRIHKINMILNTLTHGFILMGEDGG